jgi:hypothetical protein
LLKVWLEIITVTARSEMSLRTASLSGSLPGPSPAEGVARPVGAGAAATPEAGVVAVEVGAAQAAGEVVVARAGAVLRRRGDRDRAVLALHLVVEGGEVTEAARLPAEILKPSTLTTGTRMTREPRQEVASPRVASW